MTTEPGDGGGRLAHRLAEAARGLIATPLAPGLHLVATPIGNLGDITVRALAALALADLVYCEDTRHSRTLLAHYGIDRALQPYHEHNAERERPRILAALAEGRSVALISDAGTPLVSDPGYKLVRAALDDGHAVTSLPGASAVLAGLVASGLPTDAFLFAGFLPPKSAARRTRIGELARVPATLVLFEAPSRVGAALDDLADVLGPRIAAVARELTKRFEEVRRGTLPELAEWAREGEVRGEIVLLIAPGAAEAASDETIRAAVAAALETESVRDAVRRVAQSLGVPRSRVYDIAIALDIDGE